MSADNGIYVLQTYGPEYRVAYAQAIDNIFGKFNDETLHWDGNKEMMLEYFKESKVYTNLEDALDKAEEMSYSYDYLEDGVCVITEFKEFKLNEE